MTIWDVITFADAQPSSHLMLLFFACSWHSLEHLTFSLLWNALFLSHVSGLEPTNLCVCVYFSKHVLDSPLSPFSSLLYLKALKPSSPNLTTLGQWPVSFRLWYRFLFLCPEFYFSLISAYIHDIDKKAQTNKQTNYWSWSSLLSHQLPYYYYYYYSPGIRWFWTSTSWINRKPFLYFILQPSMTWLL